MKLLTAYIIVSFSVLCCVGQDRNSIWCFGDSAGIDFRNPLNPVPFNSILRSKGSCSSVADENGNLLFYVGDDTTFTNVGGRVYNRLNQQMPFGWGLYTSNWYKEMIIVPMPGQLDKYYIFHTSTTGMLGVYYTIIDMSLDNGNGDVAQFNINLMQESVLDGMGAVKHANGRDWWLIYAMNHNGFPTDEFYLYLITPEGISPPQILNMGGTFRTNAGDIVFSTDGQRMLFSTITGLIETFDFDRCSGTFTNLQTVEPEFVTTRALLSAALSPDKNMVYASSNDDTSYLFQYDLRAVPIASSKDTLATFADIPFNAGMLRLGPDNKIYLSNIYANQFYYFFPYKDSIYNYHNMNLSVINSPDSIGAACNFQPYSFFLGGKRTYFGLPNNPNYELGPVTGSVCDSLISVPEFAGQANGFSVYPNPYFNKISFHAFHPSRETVLLEIENEMGSRVYERFLPFTDCEVDLSFLPRGVYFLKVTSERLSGVQKIIHL